MVYELFSIIFLTRLSGKDYDWIAIKEYPMKTVSFDASYFGKNQRKNADRIPQCEQCSAALLDGYAEVTMSLTGERKRLCWTCARSEHAIARALEQDDLLRQGVVEREF